MQSRDLDPAILFDLRQAIRDVPDFPSAGVMFKDVTPVFLDPGLMSGVLRAMADPFRESGATHVAAIESRGFILGAPMALDLGLPFVPIRKQGKLPRAVQRIDYALEYGSGVLEIHRDAVPEGGRVLVVDDVLATGGTACAAGDLVRAVGATVAGFTFLVSIDFLGGASRLAGETVASLVQY